MRGGVSEQDAEKDEMAFQDCKLDGTAGSLSALILLRPAFLRAYFFHSSTSLWLLCPFYCQINPL